MDQLTKKRTIRKIKKINGTKIEIIARAVLSKSWKIAITRNFVPSIP